jgi:hypothetical protein
MVGWPRRGTAYFPNEVMCSFGSQRLPVCSPTHRSQEGRCNFIADKREKFSAACSIARRAFGIYCMLAHRALMPEHTTSKDTCMTSTRIPDTSQFNGMHSAQLERMEADLARIVGPQGTQALLARSRLLCGSRADSRPLLLRTLLQLVRKLLGKPLAAWLLQSAPSASGVQPVRSRLR